MNIFILFGSHYKVELIMINQTKKHISLVVHIFVKVSTFLVEEDACERKMPLLPFISQKLAVFLCFPSPKTQVSIENSFFTSYSRKTSDNFIAISQIKKFPNG